MPKGWERDVIYRFTYNLVVIFFRRTKQLKLWLLWTIQGSFLPCHLVKRRLCVRQMLPTDDRLIACWDELMRKHWTNKWKQWTEKTIKITINYNNNKKKHKQTKIQSHDNEIQNFEGFKYMNNEGCPNILWQDCLKAK
jgi:hypothetical protein